MANASEAKSDERRFWATMGLLFILATVVAFAFSGIRPGEPSAILLRGEVVDRLVKAREATGEWPSDESDPAYKPGPLHKADLIQVKFRLKNVERNGTKETARYWTEFRGVGRETPVWYDARGR
jgi:hypothetical protein